MANFVGLRIPAALSPTPRRGEQLRTALTMGLGIYAPGMDPAVGDMRVAPVPRGIAVTSSLWTEGGTVNTNPTSGQGWPR